MLSLLTTTGHPWRHGRLPVCATVVLSSCTRPGPPPHGRVAQVVYAPYLYAIWATRPHVGGYERVVHGKPPRFGNHLARSRRHLHSAAIDMKISLILAHPSPGSFNHAIAATSAEVLRQTGHGVIQHDLYREQFPPLFSAAELQKDAKLEPPIARHCAELPPPTVSSSSIPTGGACRRPF